MSPLPQTRRTAGDCGFALHDLPADLASATQVRLHLTGWLNANTIADGDDRRCDIVLAAYEAVANAAEHAYPTAPAHLQQNTISIEALYRRSTGGLEITVTDRGTWKDPRPTDARGRGLKLIRAVANTTNITTGPAGTTITMYWNLDS